MSKNLLRRWTAGLMILLSLGGLASCEKGFAKTRLEMGGEVFSVEIADTPEKQAQGLMFREELGVNEGMLFVFDRDQRLSFWMKNTSLPLSLAYLASDGMIKEIYDLEPQSLRPVQSSFAVRYALEVNRGTFERLGLKVGDSVLLPPEYRPQR